MRRYRHEIDNVRAHLRSLWTVIGLEALIILALWYGWSQAPKALTVHVPPDLRSGATLTVEEVPPANVYSFAFYIFQQLNRWPEDGARDYGSAISAGRLEGRGPVPDRRQAHQPHGSGPDPGPAHPARRLAHRCLPAQPVAAQGGRVGHHRLVPHLQAALRGLAVGSTAWPSRPVIDSCRSSPVPSC
jgi:hypothetical protein